jgi:hypothetical protein
MAPSRKPKAPRNPEHYHCANPDCDRTTPLTLKGYGMYPGPDVPESRIHRVQAPQYPGFSLMCSACAHYTVVTPYAPKEGEL